jgi:hypothetical protein
MGQNDQVKLPGWLKAKIDMAQSELEAAAFDADNENRKSERLRTRNVCWKTNTP